MKLIYIKSTMEPKNYSTIRSILKKAQGEKIAPYVFKINDTQTLQEYLDKEKITYEIYQERKIINNKRALTLSGSGDYSSVISAPWYKHRNSAVHQIHVTRLTRKGAANTKRS